MNPSDGDGPVEICVNFQADWELVYKNPEIRIKCLVESCETLLMAKRMNKRGLRFLAVRSGGCSHNLVDMPVEPGELEQDPSTLEGGGGPEGNEHLWNKGRLLKIVQSLGAQAVLEHAPTRADVFLPDVNIALEYQRWDTDFQQRTEQRALAGATTTIWLFPWLPSKTPKSKKHSAFDNQVFKHGGIYVAVKNIDNHYESQCPWEDITQERTARLFASGSIAVFDPDRGALVRTSRSLATILGEIIAGDQILTNTFVFRKRDARVVPAKVWVLRDDLARVESMLTDRRRDATQTTGKDSALVSNTERVAETEHRQGTGSSAEVKGKEEQGTSPDSETPSVESPSEIPDVALGSSAATANTDTKPVTGSVPHELAPPTNLHPMTPPSTNPLNVPRRSMWKAITGWLRRL